MNIEEELSTKLNIKVSQIKAVLKLLSEGSTIPFIARYRKEMTGNLNEDQIRTIEEEYSYQENLLKRKNDVIRLIDEKGLLTGELKDSILKCQKLTEIDDLYRPYQEKKKTKATEAIKMGLEPLAKEILSFPVNGSIDTLCQKYQMETSKAMENAGYIIAEWISDNANYRKWIREYIFNNALITAKQKPKSIDEKKTYEMYYNFAEKLKDAKHFHILAINRGEEQKILNVNLSYDEDLINKYLQGKIIKNKNSFVVSYVIDNIKDALKRLILPSIEREIRAEVTKEADVKAIDNFEQNLGHLLLTRPIKNSIVLGFDPAFRTGCKLAVLDEMGTPLLIDVIYPHEPVNKRTEAIAKIRDLISKYHINLISIGNGTASRESESLVAEAIKGTDCKYIITSEAGASVYSASPLAKEEFPDLTVEKRSAISIGRRVQDPLSELVKIDPKSIGVGEYQHDVNQRDLADRLDFTVSKIVNEVGVNLNTASASILKYVSGLNKTTINHLLQNKPYKSRIDVEKVKGLSSKIYEQAIGFLRIPNSFNPLDNTGIHPESYALTNKILNDFNLDVHNINDANFKKQVRELNAEEIAATYHTDIYTIKDIIKELLNPGLDPRDSLEAPILKSDILKVTDLKPHMELQGTVRNVTSFGAFIDIGLHNDALVHISKISKSYVKNINDYLKVGDIITCYVDTVDYDNEHVGLTLIKE